MTTFSIIKKSQLEGATRIDAEYYQPEYLKLESNLQHFGSRLKTFREVLEKGNSLTGGATPLGANYSEEGIKFLRVQNIMPGYFDFSDIVFIDKKFDERELKRSHLIDNDVLLTITGISYGKSAVYKKEFGEANINQHSVRMHFKPEILPEYVSMFLNSKYGRFQSDRKITGNTRPALGYEEIREFKIPVFEEKEQQIIKSILISSDGLENKANDFYSQAENLLLEELGLKDFDEKAGLWSIVNLSEAKNAGRIDAEYFQPKYEKLISKIKSKNPETLETFIKTHSTGFPFQSENYQETGIPLIRINNIQKGYLDLSNSAYLTEKDYLLSPKDVAKPGDIVLSMSGSIGMTSLIPKDIPKSIINQRILRITPQNIEKDYLVLLLNSIVGSYQLERIGTGGLQTNISHKDIKNILIPILSKPAQQKISELVQKSHEARKKAKELLEEAKHKVEELIASG